MAPVGAATPPTARTPQGAQPDPSILPIITSQRDRFRQRNAELEEELRKQFNIISELRAEVRPNNSSTVFVLARD